MNDTQLTVFAAALLSLAFSYIPGLREWFDAKDATTKRLIMAGALFLVSAAIFASACLSLDLPFQVTCDKGGAVGLVTTFLLALAANQATFLISPKVTVEQELK